MALVDIRFALNAGGKRWGLLLHGFLEGSRGCCVWMLYARCLDGLPKLQQLSFNR